MKASDTERELPRSTSMGSYMDADYLLTHAVWENSYGSFQPETGVRFATANGKYDGFELVQHGWIDFSAAEKIILRGLRKGWSTNRISEFMCRLNERHRPSAILL